MDRCGKKLPFFMMLSVADHATGSEHWCKKRLAYDAACHAARVQQGGVVRSCLFYDVDGGVVAGKEQSGVVNTLPFL